MWFKGDPRLHMSKRRMMRPTTEHRHQNSTRCTMSKDRRLLGSAFLARVCAARLCHHRSHPREDRAGGWCVLFVEKLGQAAWQMGRHDDGTWLLLFSLWRRVVHCLSQRLDCHRNLPRNRCMCCCSNSLRALCIWHQHLGCWPYSTCQP